MRRHFGSNVDLCCLLVVLAGFLANSSPAIAQNRVDWPCQMIPMHDANQRGRAPVLTTVRLHPGGELVAAAGDDHMVCLWSLNDRQLVRRFEGHEDWVHTLAFSPNGDYLATAGDDRQVIFWEISTGAVVHVFQEAEHPVTKIAWSHDGRWIAATGFESKLRIYDVRERKMIRELDCPCSDMRALAFSPNDQQIAAAGRSGVTRIWNTTDGKAIDNYSAHNRRVRSLAFSPDGRQIATAGDDRRVHIRNIRDRQGFDLPRRPAKIFDLTFIGPDQIATGGSDNLIRLWDIANGREIGQLEGHTGSVAALDCDSALLVSAGYDTTLRVWTIRDRVASRPTTRTQR